MIRISIPFAVLILASCATARPPASQGEVRIESRSLLGDFQTTVDAVKGSNGRWAVRQSRIAFRTASHKAFRLNRAQGQTLEALLDTPGLMDAFEADPCLDPPSIQITLQWRGASETSLDQCESPPLRSQLLSLLYRR